MKKFRFKILIEFGDPNFGGEKPFNKLPKAKM